MLVEINLTQTVYDDAIAQLERYGSLGDGDQLQLRLEKFSEELAYEYRKHSTMKTALETIDLSDFRVIRDRG